MTTLRVTGLWSHPVKSMQGQPLDTAEVAADGFRGDRTWGIRDPATGKILTGRREPRLLLASAHLNNRSNPVITLPDGTRIERLGDAADQALSAWLGHPVQLVGADTTPPARAEMFADATDDTSDIVEWQMPAGRYVDVFPILVLTTASLRAGAALHPDGTWDPRRFRPNILIDAPGTDWLEDTWQDRTLEVGSEVSVTIARPASRCTMVTRPQPGLERDLDIYRTLAKAHDGNLGMWATVHTTGTLRLGDPAAIT